MTEHSTKGTVQTLRLDPKEAAALRQYLAATNQKFQSFALRLVKKAMAARSIPKSDESPVTGNSHNSLPAPEGNDSGESPVINVVPPRERHQWEQHQEEHEALDEILDSGHPVAAEAITKNLVAFRELVQRARYERDTAIVPGSERLSDADVARIRDQGRAADQLAKDAARDRTQHASGRKGRGSPKTGTH